VYVILTISMRRWYVRDFQGTDLTEVPDFRQAEILARKISRTNSSGLMEVIVEEDSGTRFVTGIFLRGKKRQQGQRARTSSQLGLPPTL
jgi:hypothetical protein